MTSRQHRLLLVPIAMLIAVSCSGEADPESSEARQAVLGPTSTTTTYQPATTTADPDLAGFGGLIAATDRAGLQLVEPSTGAVEHEYVPDGFVTQPTWSRDGSRLVAMAYDGGPPGRLLLVDAETGASQEAPAPRGYFFFSWSHDGSRIAALGPGSPSVSGPPMTALDILDRDGRLVSSGRLEGSSVYVAWEPQGDALLVHQDLEVLVFEDPTDLNNGRRVNTPGTAFQAPAWIPGTGSALVVSESPTGGELTQIDVDTGEEVDLGPAGGFALLAVAPDGLTAAVAHSVRPAGTTAVALRSEGAETSQGGELDRVSEISAVVELIDLPTGERTPVSDEVALWIEWSPAGDALIALHADLTWSVWTGDSLRTLVESRPSSIFFDRYVAFSGQYNETPRLWSPAGDAITYSGETEDGNRLFVLPVRGDDEPEAVDVGPGHVAFWSPA